jgi:hypothetical protein
MWLSCGCEIRLLYHGTPNMFEIECSAHGEQDVESVAYWGFEWHGTRDVLEQGSTEDQGS